MSDGSIGDAAHSARTSDHNPDGNGVVRAIDVTEWDPGTPHDESDDVAEVIAETIRARKDPRVKYVIWRGRMFSSYWSGGVPPWTWRRYSGSNGHFKHVHISVHPAPAGDARGSWGIATPTAIPNPGGFLMALSESEQRALVRDVADIKTRLGDVHQLALIALDEDRKGRGVSLEDYKAQLIDIFEDREARAAAAQGKPK